VENGERREENGESFHCRQCKTFSGDIAAGEEVEAALRAGVTHVGHNYVQEAERMIPAISHQPSAITWHMIGHLQKNKVKKAVRLFDMIETVDSWPLAELIDRRCAAIGKTMPVLVEINSGRPLLPGDQSSL
jgi:uncharacterized pyridoxal phosphate-containing UPF0001 family protein